MENNVGVLLHIEGGRESEVEAVPCFCSVAHPVTIALVNKDLEHSHRINERRNKDPMPPNWELGGPKANHGGPWLAGFSPVHVTWFLLLWRCDLQTRNIGST
jgi:hypothetical protein